MSPAKKARSSTTSTASAKSFLALEPEEQEDFEKRIAAHKKKAQTPKSTGASASLSGSNIRGVVYLGHVPHGFYEKEMKAFFSQFGRVTRLRLSRSKKTGRSKGYAYLEFEHEEVAKVAADTMNNYLMYRQILKCEFMPAEKVHPNTFKGCNREFRAPTGQQKSRERHNAEKSKEQEGNKRRIRSKRLASKMAALKAMGIDYECQVEKPLENSNNKESMDVEASTQEAST